MLACWLSLFRLGPGIVVTLFSINPREHCVQYCDRLICRRNASRRQMKLTFLLQKFGIPFLLNDDDDETLVNFNFVMLRLEPKFGNVTQEKHRDLSYLCGYDLMMECNYGQWRCGPLLRTFRFLLLFGAKYRFPSSFS